MRSLLRKIYKKYKDGSLKEMYLEAKWMYQYAKKYWMAILYYIVLGVLGTVMSLATSVASKNLIDRVTGANHGNLAVIVGCMIGLTVGTILVNAVSNRISCKISLKVNREMQENIFEKIIDTDWENIADFHSGDILNRFTNDVGIVSSSVIGWVPSLITQLVQFVGVLAVILYYDPTMALIALLSAPIMLVVSTYLMKKMRNYNKKMRKISSDMTAFNEESFQNLQQIKAFDLLGIFKKKMHDVQERYMDTSLDYNRFSVYTSLFMSLVGAGVSFACFGWGVYRLWGGYITFGTMTLFLELSGNLSGSFSALVNMVPSAISATTSAGRIMEIADLPNEKLEIDQEVEAIKENLKEGNALSVHMQNVDFTYHSGKTVLTNVNVTAEPGEIIALIGPSGEGKTTMIRILLGLLNPQSGEIYIEDKQKRKADISASSRCFFSYVPQGNTIFSGTIAENMRMMATDASDQEIIEALKIACAYDFVEKLPEGIYGVIGEKGAGISEGQAQRLSIARAILRKSPILVLDEATSALDIDTEHKVLHNIMEYTKDCTCIVTTHRPSVLDMCDKVYRISETMVKEV